MILIVAERQTFYSYDGDGIEQVGGFKNGWVLDYEDVTELYWGEHGED